MISNYANPYPYYAETRLRTPIFQDEQGNFNLTRYHDVVVLLSDPRFQRRSPVSFGYVHKNEAESKVDAMISKWSLFSDPPQHTHLREMLHSILHPRFIKDTKIMIQSVAESLISSLMKQTHANFMEHFAYPFPIGVINRLLGTDLPVPTARKWSFAVATAMDHGTLADLEAVTPFINEMEKYFHELVMEREAHPREDWISELVKLKKPFQQSTEDVVSNCIFLLLSAHETLQLVLGLGMLSLIKHPDQRILLQQNPDLIPSAVEEILRYDAPWNKMSRWSYEEVQFDEIIIPRHKLVTGLINSANRDPARFADPEKFDITRSNNRHLAFGHGIHTCHGALLARLELQAAYTGFLPYFDRLSVKENEIKWMNNSSLRYITHLPLDIHHDD